MRSNKRPDRTGDAIALLAQIAREYGVDVQTLRSKEMQARADRYVKIRRDFSVRGRAMGLKAVELGIALNRDYTTISYHTSPQMRAAKAARRPIERLIRKAKRGEHNAQV